MTGAELRASILQAAVQGKLVPQDPTDEPASALLERIREKRRALVKAGKAKAPKGGESVITRCSDGTVWETRGKGKPVEITDEVPFDIPDGWKWVRVSDACEAIVDCPHSTPKYLSEDTGYVAIDTNCIDDNWHITGWRDLSEDAYAQRVSRLVPRVGDLVFTREGSIGRSAILDRENVCLGQRVMIMRPMAQLAVRYLQIVLSSPSASVLYKTSQKGTAARHINVKDVCAFLLPLPPIAEQHRIVAKLDELIPLIERYDRLERERTELNAGIEGAMRASVLQAAVQGQLSEREDGDEPACELLERIREERCVLVKAGKAKALKGGESRIWRASDGTVWEQRGKGNAVDITDEVPFDIPDGWEWARLSQIGEIIGGGTPKTSEPTFWASDNDPEGIPWVTPADMRGMGGLMVCRGARNITKAGLEGSSAQLMPTGTVLMSSRAPIGYLGVASNPVSTNQGFKSVVCIEMDMNLWVVTAIDALMDGIKERASGTTFKEISGTEFGLTLIPVPPLAEQQRIVAKLDELLPMTEKLGKLVS